MVRKIAVAVLLGLSALFFFLFYDHYFKWRGCFDAQGRCFDHQSGVVYMEQSGFVWLSLALLTLGVLIHQVWRLSR